MEQYIGKLLDNRYELQEVIGTGGMAVVYKARCHRLNRLVAVKVLKSELAQDAEFRRRFHDESQAVAMLSHPNIVSVYDVSRSDDLNYIVMELIDGITLKQYMQKKGTPLNWREALHFITQIMKALGHAHSRGIIHRDIKPHNIMVLRDGSVKVADFGIARLASSTQNTLTQEALGSVHYISPEQARGSRIDERSDIYSAGVVLYEMITGRLPYEGDSPVSVAIQHINSIPLSPRDLNPEIPEALEAITMKAMASNVSQRYESANAMLSDLEEFRKNPSINFDFVNDNLFSDSLDEPTQVVSSVRTGAESRRQRSSQREEERHSPWPVIVAVAAILIFIGGIVYFLWNFFLSGLLTQTESYTVPDLRGMTLEEISEREDITSIFIVYEGGTAESDEYEKGEVMAQDPAPESTVKEKGLTITVTISLGKEELTMPDVVNQEERNATSQLEQMGLTVEREEGYSDTITQGYIMSTDPAKGEALEEGQTVTITVSKGPEKKLVTVTNLVGLTLDDAKATIEDDLNLTLAGVTEVYNDTYEAGKVVFQDIAVGTQVIEGSDIKLEVSKGPENTGTDTTGGETSETGTGENGDSTGTTDSTATDAVAIASTRTIMVDLSEYSGMETVTVRITVGGIDKYNNTVDPNKSPLSASVTGSGVQEVIIYVNNKVQDSYPVDFSQK